MLLAGLELAAKVPKTVARRTRLLRKSIVRESNKSHTRESPRYVEERLYFSVVTLISADFLLLAKDSDRFPHPIIHVSEISAQCSVTWT